MTAKNLAVVFGPTLLRDQDSSRDLLDMNAKNTTVEYIISITPTLFSSEEDSS
jgi:Rho-type GTPase-activating protein 1/2